MTLRPGRYPARAGGPWLWSTLVLFLFHALVVPSGLTTRVQPQRVTSGEVAIHCANTAG